jgi:hypothetical protein
MSALLSGCGVMGATVPVDASSAPRGATVTPSTIAIYATGTPPQPYMIVGFLSADAPTSDEAIAELRRRAAALGGDAIVALDVSLGGIRGVHATGAAVRYS